MDDNRNRKLDLDEFKTGLQDYGLHFTKEETRDLFNAFDVDKSGQIDFDEFLDKLRVILNELRLFEMFVISIYNNLNHNQ